MLDPLVPLFGGLPGGPELIVILLIIVLLFGAQKLPKLARSTGEAMGEFQKGREEVEQELEEMREGRTKEDTTTGVESADTATDATTTDPTTTEDTGTTEVAEAETDEK